MTPSLLFLVVDAASVTCALLIGIRVLTGLPRQANAQLVALLCLSAICHVVLARYDYRAWIAPAYRIEIGAVAPALNILRNLAPGLFMILVHRLFADGRRLPGWLLTLFAVQVFLEDPVQWLLPAGADRAPLLTELLPTLLQTLFAGLALYWTLGDWRGDLVEARRRIRAVVVVILAVNVVASSLLLRVLIPWDSAANYQAHLALSVFNLAILGWLTLRLPAGEIDRYLVPERNQRRAEPEPGATPDRETTRALARLAALMEGERIYRQPGLSLKALADRVGLPEYRLRRLIHEELGHRNFNAFLHERRIAEACAQMRDPALRRTPILTIALSVGYQSVNTFNRGFREVMGVTPSAFRAQAGDENPRPDSR